jgi:integrase
MNKRAAQPDSIAKLRAAWGYGEDDIQSVVIPKKRKPSLSYREPWNKGQIIGQKPPLQAKHVWAIRHNLEAAGARRDLALFNIAIDSKLLGHEVVKLRVSDVAPNGKVAVQGAWTRESKKPIRFEIGEESQQALADYLKYSKRGADDFLFGSRGKETLGSRQFARLVSQWVTDIGLDPLIYGTHSLRRTKAMLIYQQTGNLRIVQAMLGHKKAETTVVYLGIGECEDTLEIAGQAGI